MKTGNAGCVSLWMQGASKLGLTSTRTQAAMGLIGLSSANATIASLAIHFDVRM